MVAQNCGYRFNIYGQNNARGVYDLVIDDTNAVRGLTNVSDLYDGQPQLLVEFTDNARFLVRADTATFMHVANAHGNLFAKQLDNKAAALAGLSTGFLREHIPDPA